MCIPFSLRFSIFSICCSRKLLTFVTQKTSRYWRVFLRFFSINTFTTFAIAALTYRKSKRPLLLAALLLCFSTPASAWHWMDLWKTPDQQGVSRLRNGDPRSAADLFTIPAWKGVALYRAGVYDKAAAEFNNPQNATAWYNLGNAQAHLENYTDAIAAYEKALQLEPDFKDAAFNRDLLKRLAQQQQQGSSNSNNSSQQSSKNRNDKNSNSNNKNQLSQTNTNLSKESLQNMQNQAQNNASQQQAEVTSDPKTHQTQDFSHYDTAQQTNPNEKTTTQSLPMANHSQQTSPQKATQTNDLPLAMKNSGGSEQQQATQQWLRRVPDQPGVLLQQIFLRDYLRRQQQKDNS